MVREKLKMPSYLDAMRPLESDEKCSPRLLTHTPRCCSGSPVFQMPVIGCINCAACHGTEQSNSNATLKLARKVVHLQEEVEREEWLMAPSAIGSVGDGSGCGSGGSGSRYLHRFYRF